MKKQIIAVVAAIGLSFAVATPADAWYRGGWGGGWGYGGGWGGYGYGGGWGYAGAAAGAALLGGVIGGALASPYGYGYGYAPAYGYAPSYGYAPTQQKVQKNIIIKNSPGARVVEEDDFFGW